MPIFNWQKNSGTFSSIKKPVLFIKVHGGKKIWYFLAPSKNTLYLSKYTVAKKSDTFLSPPQEKTLENLVFHVVKKHFPSPSVFRTLQKSIFAYLVI